MRQTISSIIQLSVVVIACLQTVLAASKWDAIEHIIVLVQENWSFDGLYSELPGVVGVTDATYVPQVNQTGHLYDILPRAPNENDTCCDPRFPDLPNKEWRVDDYVTGDQKTADLTHRFYTHQFQINKGKLDKFVAWSNAGALVVGRWKAHLMPMGLLAQNYSVCDNFFQAAFGGSFLSHQWLISSQAPYWNATTPPDSIVSKIDFEAGILQDKMLTTDGKNAINTAYSQTTPHPASATNLLELQTHDTIGDRLSGAGVSWKWYSGGWNDAINGKAAEDFQYHHQAYAYFAKYAEGTQGRAEHLRDEADFYTDLAKGELPQVSWMKFIGDDNEHPGYAQLYRGQKHATDLIDKVMASPIWNKTAIFVTYDEFGGHFDHVVPPVRDRWGPGSRIGCFVISPWAKKRFVDHTYYTHDSIQKFINVRFGLQPLTYHARDANNFDNSFDFTSSSNDSGSMKDIALIVSGTILATGLIVFVYCLCRRRTTKSGHSELVPDDEDMPTSA